MTILVIVGLLLLYKKKGNSKIVETTNVSRGNICEFIKATGRVEAVEKAIVRAKVQAQIEEVLVEEGCRVKVGDSLIQFDLTKIEDNIKKARVKLEQAQIAVNKSKVKLETSEWAYSDPSELESNLEAKKNKYRQAIISKEMAEREFKIAQELYHLEAEALLNVKDKESKLKNAEIKLLQAEREMEEAKKFFTKREKSQINLTTLKAEYENALKQKSLVKTELDLAICQRERLEVTSPLNGTVISKEAKDGILVSVGQALITIADTERLQIRAEIDEFDAGKIRIGQKAIITFDAFPNQEFPGHVKKIAPQALIKREKTIVETVIFIDEHIGLLKISNQVDIKVFIEEKKGVLVLPLFAIHQQNKPFVWLYQNGNAHKVKIKTGKSDIDSIEIIEGLKENDQVILNKYLKLQDGERVRIK